MRARRIGCAALVVGTILAHGAALAGIGLALATWIKRQSRSIAASICIFVLLAVAWPILMAVVFTGNGPLTNYMGSLSPIVAVIVITGGLPRRLDGLPELAWWIGFWDVGVFALAIEVLWLTCRTFDRCFERIPDNPRTRPALADAVAVLAGTAAPCCLYIAITIWAQGIYPHSLSTNDNKVIWCYLLLVLLGLFLLSGAAPRSIWAEQRGSRLGSSAPSTRSAAVMILFAWWRVLRLVLLLALGPGLIAFALATARSVEPGEVISTRKLVPPPGQSARPLNSEAMNAVVPPLGDRLRAAAMIVLSILVYGAAVTSAGLALAVWVKRRSWAVGSSIGLFALVAVVWPLVAALVTDPVDLPGAYGLPLIVASHLTQLLSRRTLVRDVFPGSVFSIVLVMIAAVVFLWLAIRKLQGDRLQSTSRELVAPIPHSATEAVLARH
jgi:hypothetical protein